jgi:hypothetical protein
MKKREKIDKREKNVQRKERSRKTKMIRELCEAIAWRFIAASHEGLVDGPYPLQIVDEICPWENLVSDDDDGKWDSLNRAMESSFAFGYVLGQMLDIPDIDITPIKELLKERKVLLYLPHEKKAA